MSHRLYERLRTWLLPGLQNSHVIYAGHLQAAVALASRWLDLGCGHEFLPSWIAPAARELDLTGRMVTGLDMNLDAIRRHPLVICQASEGLPVTDNCRS